MTRIAIIPARGGSKRIPRKNIRHFHGKPMIAFAIELARSSRLFDRIIVSTDDAEIAAIAQNFGAEIPFIRPPELANDFATTMEVIQHGIRCLHTTGELPEYVCCIYATAPFLQAQYLEMGIDMLMSRADKSYAFSVTSFPFPVQRAVRISETGCVCAIYPEFANTRSQDLEHAYHDAGQFYWGRTAAWLRGDMLFSEASLAVIMPRYLVQDIDTQEDWTRAELMYKSLVDSGDLMA